MSSPETTVDLQRKIDELQESHVKLLEEKGNLEMQCLAQEEEYENDRKNFKDALGTFRLFIQMSVHWSDCLAKDFDPLREDISRLCDVGKLDKGNELYKAIVARIEAMEEKCQNAKKTAQGNPYLV